MRLVEMIEGFADDVTTKVDGEQLRIGAGKWL